MGAGSWPSVLHFKGINRKKKKEQEQNLERGFNPSVGKVKQEQDQQQQQENNKNKRKATTTKLSSKPTKNISIQTSFNNEIQKLLKQNNIKSKRNKRRKKTRGLQNKRNK